MGNIIKIENLPTFSGQKTDMLIFNLKWNVSYKKSTLSFDNSCTVWPKNNGVMKLNLPLQQWSHHLTWSPFHNLFCSACMRLILFKLTSCDSDHLLLTWFRQQLLWQSHLYQGQQNQTWVDFEILQCRQRLQG